MSPEDLAGAFLDALCCRDFERIRQWLADDVWVRAMLVREIVEVHDASAALALFESWYGSAADLHAVDTRHHTVMSRQFVSYRFELLPHWQPDVWHVIEQAGYVTVKDARITRIDLTCTGYFPLPTTQAKLEDLHALGAEISTDFTKGSAGEPG